MCGLFGIHDSGSALTEPQLLAARKSLDALRHRGPDQWGEYVRGGTYLGHRRLSILDISECGRQPMVDEAAGIAIAVNGEIYNYKGLRQQLGVDKFRSQSDSEVVLHGYLRWGIEGLLQKMEGMYAGVVADFQQQRIYLFRDRFGIKPLYYTLQDGVLLWASELKAIARYLPSSALQLDPAALLDFATYGYVPAPKSIYRRVQKLPAASYLCHELSNRAVRVHEYWRLTADETPRADAQDEVRELLAASVAEQLVSDVPLGFLLSGGLDSSAIVALAVGQGANSTAFSIGFDAPEHDETPYARLMAQHLRIPHEVRILNALDARDLSQWLMSIFDEPFADTSALATYAVAQLARAKVTVALSGDGGDELFGGYDRYLRFAKASRVQRISGWFLPRPQRLPGSWRSNRARRLATAAAVLASRDPLELYKVFLPGASYWDREHYRTVLGVPSDYDCMWFLRQHWRPELSLRKRLQYLDLKTYLAEFVLTKLDRVTMAVALESRVPFLSRALAECSFGLPETFIYQGNTSKGGLKRALAELLPAPIIDRPKKGFSIPIKQWGAAILGSNRTLIDAVIFDHFAVSR